MNVHDVFDLIIVSFKLKCLRLNNFIFNFFQDDLLDELNELEQEELDAKMIDIPTTSDLPAVPTSALPSVPTTC